MTEKELPASRQNEARTGSSLGITSLVLGTLGFLTCWIPFVNMIGIPLAALGLILAFFGLIAALRNQGIGGGFSLGGLALCGLALFVAIWLNNTVSGALTEMAVAQEKAVSQMQAELKSPPPAETSLGTAPSIDTWEPPSRVAARAAVSETWEPLYTPEPTPTPIPWADARLPLRYGAATVQILQAANTKLVLADPSGRQRGSNSTVLAIQLRISNQSEGRMFDYVTWRGNGYSSDLPEPIVTDNFGNVYDLQLPMDGLSIVGSTDFATLYAGQSIEDVLTFKPVAPGARELFLELPGVNLGSTGALRFRIPYR